METQYEELAREDSIPDSSSEDVGNLKFHKVIIFCVFFLGFLQNQVHSECEVWLILIILGGGGDREGVSWCNVWGAAESTFEWGTCFFPETQRRQKVKKG